MATIEEMEGGGRKRGRDGGEETDGELDSPSEEEWGNEFLAMKAQVSISWVCPKKKNGCFFSL